MLWAIWPSSCFQSRLQPGPACQAILQDDLCHKMPWEQGANKEHQRVGTCKIHFPTLWRRTRSCRSGQYQAPAERGVGDSRIQSFQGPGWAELWILTENGLAFLPAAFVLHFTRPHPTSFAVRSHSQGEGWEQDLRPFGPSEITRLYHRQDLHLISNPFA